MMTDFQALQLYATRRDAEAFRFLVQHYQRLVYSVAARRLGHAHDIDDAVQLTFLKLARAAGTVKRDIASWLYSTALNTANDLIRRDQARRRHESRAPFPPPHAADTDAEDREELQKLSTLIDDALLQLPADQRSLLVEHFFQNRSQRDLAETLGVSQPTIQHRLSKSIDALRQLLAKQGLSAPALFPAALHTLTADAPAHLTASLTKIGLAGSAGTTAGSAAAVSTTAKGAGLFLALSTTTKAILAAAALLLAGGLVATSLLTHSTPASAPAAAVPATAPLPRETPLAKGDTIDITLSGLVTGQNFRAAREITDTGDISLPNYDPIHAAGLTPAELEQSITKAAADRGFVPPKDANSPSPQITVRLRPSTPLARLQKLYALADNQNVRRISDFPPERADFLDARFPGPPGAPNSHINADGTPDTGYSNLFFRVRGGSMSWNSSARTITLPRIIEMAGVPWFQVDKLDSVQWKPAPADWIFRSPLAVNDALDGIGKIVADDLGKPFHFEKRALRRPCIILAGQLHEATKAEARRNWPLVFITLESLSDDDLTTRRAPPPPRRSTDVATSMLGAFDGMAQQLDAPFFGADPANNRILDATIFEISTLLKLRSTGPDYRQNLQRVLSNIQSQIGGTWTIEDRDIDTWEPVFDQPPADLAPTDLDFTRVTVNFDNLSGPMAAQAFSEQAGFSVRLLRDFSPPPISLHLQNVTYLNALIQFTTITNGSIVPRNASISYTTIAPATTPLTTNTWTASGPFAAIVTESGVEYLGRAANNVSLGIEFHIEPQNSQYILFPDTLLLDSFIDDLKQPILLNPRFRPSLGGRYYVNSRTLSIPLLLPPTPGTRIALLKGAAPFRLVTHTQTLTTKAPTDHITLPVGEAGAGGVGEAASIEFLPVAIKPGGPNQMFREFECEVRFHRNKLDADAWRTAVIYFDQAKLNFLDSEDQAIPAFAMSMGFPDDQSVNYTFRTSANRKQTNPQSVRFEIPTESRRILFPFEFKDLPLPTSGRPPATRRGN